MEDSLMCSCIVDACAVETAGGELQHDTYARTTHAGAELRARLEDTSTHGPLCMGPNQRQPLPGIAAVFLLCRALLALALSLVQHGNRKRPRQWVSERSCV